jgi:hypothetical protein
MFMPIPALGRSHRNLIAGFAGGFFIAGFAAFVGLTRYWISIATKVAVSSLGRLYAHNEHGSITYFTAFEATASALLFWSGLASLLVFFAVSPKRNVAVTRWRGVPLGARWQNDDPHGRLMQGAAAGALFGVLVIFVLGPVLVQSLVSTGVVLAL